MVEDWMWVIIFFIGSVWYIVWVDVGQFDFDNID